MMQREETQPSHETTDNHQSKGRQFFCGGFEMSSKQTGQCVSRINRGFSG